MGTRQTVWCDAYVDGKLTKSTQERRMVYTRPDGTRFIQTYWKGRESHDLDDQNHWRLEARTVRLIKLGRE